MLLLQGISWCCKREQSQNNGFRNIKTNRCLVCYRLDLNVRFDFIIVVDYNQPLALHHGSVKRVCRCERRVGCPVLQIVPPDFFPPFFLSFYFSFSLSSLDGLRRRGWIRVCKSPDTLWFTYQINLLLKFHSESEIQANIILKHAKSKIWANEMDKSAIHCNCWICKSVKILLWTQNSDKNVFKIHPSVGPFTPPLRKNKRLLVVYQRVIMRPMWINQSF